MDSALFLDRDGTIIKDGGHISNVNQVKFYDFTFTALRKAQKYFKLFIITNQPGIAYGFITHGDVKIVNSFILSVLSKKGIHIEDVFYCPHAKEDSCQCRKPNTFFVDQAVSSHKLNISNSFVVGDHPSDVLLAKRSGMQGIYVLTGHGQKHKKEISEDVLVKRNLNTAIDFIIKRIQS